MDSTAIARVCHEANRAVQLIQGDPGIPIAAPWDDFPADEQAGVINGVDSARSGATPEQLHDLWCQEKTAAGWTYGPTKDTAAKTHPCLLPYQDLPDEQRTKDRLFAAIVTALAIGADPA